jgi:hypothetical protein
MMIKILLNKDKLYLLYLRGDFTTRTSKTDINIEEKEA